VIQPFVVPFAAGSEPEGRRGGLPILASRLAWVSLPLALAACGPPEPLDARIERERLVREKEALEAELARTEEPERETGAVVSVHSALVREILEVALPVEATVDRFKVTATTSSQLYYGYDWETAHTNIKTAAEDTRGKIVMYLNGSTNEIALTPYSSWSDGRTRSFEERWGSTAYPWCRSVDDPYGKHATKSTATLENEGNHMVGLIANGSLNLATNYGWDWDDILGYYFYNINLHQAY